jgi:hypothetical protein
MSTTDNQSIYWAKEPHYDKQPITKKAHIIKLTTMLIIPKIKLCQKVHYTVWQITPNQRLCHTINYGPKKFYNIGHRAGTKERNNEGKAVKFKGKV